MICSNCRTSIVEPVLLLDSEVRQCTELTRDGKELGLGIVVGNACPCCRGFESEIQNLMYCLDSHLA